MPNNIIKTAVVNGPLGTVGIALVKVLLEKGVDTWAVCYPGDSRIVNIPREAHIVECDMRNIDQLPQMIDKSVDAFFHLAWMGTIGEGRNDAFLQSENIRCAVNAVNSAKKISATVFIGVGSQAEHGRIDGLVSPDSPCNPVTGYGAAKLCAGQLTRLAAHKLGIRHEWVRILSAYGPGDGSMSVFPTIITKLLKKEKPSLTKGEQLWDFCFSWDVAEALYQVAVNGKDGKIYPVGSGIARPLHEYFEITRDAIDPSLPLGIGELPYNPNQVMHLQADLSALESDTYFTPRYSFEEGIKITIDSYKRTLHDET